MDQIGEMVLHNGTAAPLGFILHPPLIVRERVSCEGVRFIFKIGKDLLRALNFKIWGERGRGGLNEGIDERVNENDRCSESIGTQGTIIKAI